MRSEDASLHCLKCGNTAEKGGIELAEGIFRLLEIDKRKAISHRYIPMNRHSKEKIETISKEIYGAKGIEYAPAAEKQLAKIEQMGFGNFPTMYGKESVFPF